MLKAVASASRRCESRIEISDGVWIIWRCSDREMVSTVQNISPGGLFVECASPRPPGATAEVHFLVPEGKIAGSHAHGRFDQKVAQRVPKVKF
jgi:hypothetical protein